MSSTQNNNLITLSSNELVRYSNNFKVISKYGDKSYESNEVELLNLALDELEVKILEPVKDENDITLTAVVENGDSNQTYKYEWFIYKEDGETELPHGIGTDSSIVHIEYLNTLDQFCLASVAAYTSTGLFVGISDVKTIYKDTEDVTSPVIVDLSNDSATIPAELVSSNTDEDKKLFQELTATYLTVLRGDNDITSSCTIEWKASSADIQFSVSANKRSVHITEMPAALSAGSLTATVEYPKAQKPGESGTLTVQYNIIRASAGTVLYQLSLPQKAINTTYFTNNETYTYSYRVKKCSGKKVTFLSADQLDEEGLEVAWGYKEAQDVDLEDYTWEPTVDGTFEYQIGTHTGLHIVLRSKNENDLARYYDSEIVPFVRDGGVFTDLVLSANSPSFNVDANGNFAQNTVELTASLYGELEGKEAGIEWTWSIGKDLLSGTVSADRKTFTLTKADMADNNAIEVTATIKLNGEDYYDKMTIYKLKEGSSAITAFLTNQCINFSANADGIVNADNNNTHISKVRVFRGSEDISDLVDVVTTPDIVPEGMDIVIESITENNKQLKQIKVGITGTTTNLGGPGSCDGELEFNVTLTGSEAKIPLTLSWSKNNAGRDGAAGLNGTSPYTIQLDNDSDMIVKSSNGDWFVNDTDMAIVVNAACYKGDQKDDTVTSNDCKCGPPSTDWENGCYSWDGKVLRITKVPDNFISGYFTFSWIKSGVTLATKNFSLSSTIALADYDLIIPQVVYNVDNVKDGETFAISVLKKSKDKIETLTSRGSEKIQILGPDGKEVTDWGVVPVPQEAGNYTYTLKSTTADNLTWDEEVLTTVSDGVDGLGYTGIQLVAPSQVFVRNPNTGAITPDSVKLTAKLSGDLKGQTSKLKWYKDGSLISSNNGKNELQVASSNLSEDKKQVTYKVKVDDGNANDNDDYDDEFSFYLVTEGADAYSAWLSDQSWSFTGDKDGYVAKNITKSTTVKIYKGGEEVTSGINITSTTESSGDLASGGTFTPNGATLTFTTKNINNNNLGGAKNADGTIDIKAKLGDKEFDLVLSWDKISTGDSGDNGTSPYLIELTNDSATIGTDKDGKCTNKDALQTATETSAQVWLGSTDITNACSFTWTGSNCTLPLNNSTKTIYLTAISDTEDTATATVAVTHGQISVGNKTLTVTKNKQGETGNDAVTYVLSVSPNSWNKTEIPGGITPTIAVTKYIGNTASLMNSSDYTIKTGQNQYTGTAITDTTTFDLYINGIDEKVDSETVSAVANGNDSTVEGPPGPGIVSETRLYKWGSTQPTADKDGLEQSELQTYEHYKNAGFLWMYYEQTWTADSGKVPTYTPPIRMTDYEMGTLMASRENGGQGVSIAAWCEKYGRTLIDGSTIVAGSIKTAQLDANAVTTDKLAADAVTAAKIKINDYAEIQDAKIADWSVNQNAIHTTIGGISTGISSLKADIHYVTADDGIIFVKNEDNSYTVQGILKLEDANCTQEYKNKIATIQELYIPAEYGGMKVTKIADHAFAGKYSIKENGVDVTKDRTDFIKIKKIVVPNSVTHIGKDAFGYNSNLEFVDIGNSVTTFAQGIIYNCPKIAAFTIPESVTTIGPYCFGYCKGIKSIFIPKTVTTVSYSQDFNTDNLVFYCEAQSKPSGWSDTWSKHYGQTDAGQYIHWGRTYENYLKENALIESLAIPDSYSEARIFAGSSSKIPLFKDSANFMVLEDGSLYAKAVDITGTIHATDGEFEGKIIAHNGGKIGDLEIQNGGLESDLIQLNHTGLRLTGGEVSIGANSDVVINTQNEKGVWDTASQDIESVVFSSRTNKPFVIKNSGGAGIYFSNVTAHQTGEIKYSIKTDMEYKMANGERNGGYLYFKYFIENNDAFNYNHTVLLFMRLQYNGIAGTSNIYLNLTIPAYSNSGLCTIANMAGSTVGGNTLEFENNRVVFPTAPSANFASGEFYQTVREWGGAVEGPYIGFGNFASLDGDKKIFDYVYTPYRVDNNVLYSLGSFFPSKEQLSLGESNQPCDKIYSSSGTVQSSDIRLKNSIQPLSNSYEIFYDQINPVLYRLNNGTSNRLHAGFIAQEIEKALNNANISTKDFAGVCIGQDEQKTRGVRYEEFVPLNIWQIQKLKKRAAEDEQIIQRQAETIAQLEERLARIESLLEKNP